MSKRKSKCVPIPNPAIWHAEGKQYKAREDKLRDAIQASPHSAENLARRLGSLSGELEAILSGQSVCGWTAQFIDWAIAPDQAPVRMPTWPPLHS
jgi:hypothetical protein